MKIAVIYYSKSGCTKQVATEMATLLKADLKEIISLEKRDGIIGFIKSGFQASFKKEARIGFVMDDIESYDLIILCGPVWASNMSSPIRTFLNKYGSKIQNIAYILMHQSAENSFIKVAKDMSELINKRYVAYLSLTQKKEANYSTELFDFAKQIAHRID